MNMCHNERCHNKASKEHTFNLLKGGSLHFCSRKCLSAFISTHCPYCGSDRIVDLNCDESQCADCGHKQIDLVQ